MKGYGTPIVTADRPMLGVRYGIGLSHGRRGGGPVLRTEASWRTVNGLWINTPRGACWLLFRRWSA